MRIISLNMNGIRAAERKGFYPWLEKQNADVICLQETRIQQHQLTEQMLKPKGMHSFFNCAERPGYSGVAIYSKQKPTRVHLGIGWGPFDAEGRMIRLDFGQTSVISLYLPSGSSKDSRQVFKYQCMDKIKEYMDSIAKTRRKVVICGDWNIAHTEKDLKNWRGNKKNSGFLPEERAWMTSLFSENKWHDNFRDLYPCVEGDGYTWWSNRGNAFANNTGWRIDYQICTSNIAKKAVRSRVFKGERFSDHAPLIADYAL